MSAGAAVVAVVAGLWAWDWSKARAAWRDADEALRRRDLPAAAAHLDRYTAQRPDDPGGWLLAARTARRRGRFPDAERLLAECQRAGGATDATRLEADLRNVQQGDFGEIDARLRATVGPDHPDAAVVLEALARAYLSAERWPDAHEACRLWRAIDPAHPWPWLWSGWIAERLHQPEAAEAAYRKAVEADPEDRAGRTALGRALIRQRQPAAAAEHYEWVLAHSPDDPEAVVGLAGCRVEQGRPSDALRLLDRLPARDPPPGALLLRGRAAMDLGDPAAAEGWLRRALAAHPTDAEALHQLVLSLRAQRKDADADPLARRLEQMRADLRRLGELVQAITPDSRDVKTRHEAGVVALRLGRTKEGLNYLQDALRHPGDHRPTHAALADHYRQAGDPGRAAYHQSLAGRP